MSESVSNGATPTHSMRGADRLPSRMPHHIRGNGGHVTFDQQEVLGENEVRRALEEGRSVAEAVRELGMYDSEPGRCALRST